MIYQVKENIDTSEHFCLNVCTPLQFTGELELDVWWLKSAEPGRQPGLPWWPKKESDVLWRLSSSWNRPVIFHNHRVYSLHLHVVYVFVHAQLDSPARGLRAGPGLPLELFSEDDCWLGVELRVLGIWPALKGAKRLVSNKGIFVHIQTFHTHTHTYSICTYLI